MDIYSQLKELASISYLTRWPTLNESICYYFHYILSNNPCDLFFHVKKPQNFNLRLYQPRAVFYGVIWFDDVLRLGEINFISLSSIAKLNVCQIQFLMDIIPLQILCQKSTENIVHFLKVPKVFELEDIRHWNMQNSILPCPSML